MNIIHNSASCSADAIEEAISLATRNNPFLIDTEVGWFYVRYSTSEELQAGCRIATVHPNHNRNIVSAIALVGPDDVLCSSSYEPKDQYDNSSPSFRAGYEAFSQGVSILLCPFVGDAMRIRLWKSGWRAGKHSFDCKLKKREEEARLQVAAYQSMVDDAP